MKGKGKLLKLFVFSHSFVVNHFPNSAQHQDLDDGSTVDESESEGERKK